MLTRKIPANWKELQTDAALILMQCGFESEVEKKIKTARGEVELDVFATETVTGRTYSIVCECKYWKKNIPQTVVHSLRTVCSDIGANVGYIVSLNGFQSGSYSAADLTNISLVTWDEFLSMFFETWFERYFVDQMDRLSGLLTYCEPVFPIWFEHLCEEDRSGYIALWEEHDCFASAIIPYSRHLRSFVNQCVTGPPVNGAMWHHYEGEGNGVAEAVSLMVPHGTIN